MRSPIFLSHLSSAFGLATLILGLIIMMVFPREAELTEGFNTPIIAFEFANSESGVAFLAGDSKANQQLRDQMDFGHLWDMLFPFAYAGFLSLLLLQRLQGLKRPALALVIIPLSIIPFDINENLVLLSITDGLSNGASIDSQLAQLPLATWLKWGAIGLSIAILAVFCFVQRRYAYALFGFVVALSIVYCWMSASPMLTEIMATLVFGFFLVSAISCFLTSWRLKS